MRRWLTGVLVGLLAVLAMVTLGSTTARADPRDFTLINGSPDETLTEVYVGPSNQLDWGDDILGVDVLGPGESVFIYFARFTDGDCLYDIKVLYADGHEGYMYQVNLCESDTVTFR